MRRTLPHEWQEERQNELLLPDRRTRRNGFVGKREGGAKGYVVYRSTTKNGGYVRIAAVKGAKKTSYVDRKAKKGKIWYYKIIVKTRNGYSASKRSKAVKMKN